MATIHIQTGKNGIDHNYKNSNIQSVPFKIHADCDAKVTDYFDKYIKTKKDGSKLCHNLVTFSDLKIKFL